LTTNNVNIGNYGIPVDLDWIPVRLCWRLWEKGPDGKVLPASLAHGVEVMRELAQLAVKHARWQMQFHPSIKPIYSGQIAYRYQELAEDWQDPSVMAETKLGDCDNCVIQRVAELQRDNIRAEPDIEILRNPTRFHMRVRRWSISRNLPPMVNPAVITVAENGDGFIEDVSLALGMK
jgi:hypothetical protein